MKATVEPNGKGYEVHLDGTPIYDCAFEHNANGIRDRINAAIAINNALATTVTIPKSEYAELFDARDKLDKLEIAGVDNWEGYDFAMRSDEEE